MLGKRVRLVVRNEGRLRREDFSALTLVSSKVDFSTEVDKFLLFQVVYQSKDIALLSKIV